MCLQLFIQLFELLSMFQSLAMIIFVVFPSVFILALLSVRDRPDIQKNNFNIFNCNDINGMLNEGLFSAPAMVGLAGLMGFFRLRNHLHQKLH